MKSVRSAELRAECERMCRYLIGGAPRSYVVEHYVRGHAVRPEWFAPRSAFDHTLEVAARVLPLRVVDACSRFAASGSVVRRKLVFLLAILENSSPTCDAYETPDVSRPSEFYLRLIPRGILLLGALLVGAVVLPPLHLLRRVTGG
jgi:hypothetical protein